MKKAYEPTEAEIQVTLFQWFSLQSGKYPELELAYAVPNGGSRHPLEAANLKRQGVKPGVPDICLPVPRGDYAGLYLELKRGTGGKVSENQKWWIEKLKGQGYKAVVCAGFDEASKAVLNYMNCCKPRGGEV